MTAFAGDKQQQVIVLAGAGASEHLGLPTLDDLLQRAVLGNDETADLIRDTRDAIESEPKRYKKAVFEELIVKIRDYLRIIHTLLTDRTLLGTVGGLPHGIESGSAELKWKEALTRCYRVLLQEYGPSKVNPERAEFRATLDLFSELASRNGCVLHVFTTNYDCSYQVLASNCGDLKFMTHIDNSSGKFRDQWSSVRPKLATSDIPTVYVHRLHGCVAWFTACPSGADMGADCGTIVEAYGAGRSLTIEDDDYLHRMCIKLIAAQLVGTNPVYSTAFEEFSQHLKTAESLFVWGYSFRDLEVMRQINHIVSARQSPLRVYYLDPFLPIDRVINHIRNTLYAVPITVSDNLKLQRIDWSTQDGLAQSVIQELDKEKTDDQETEPRAP
jgi:hypothetical protein